MSRILLHGALGSYDEIIAGIGICIVLVIDALLILSVWRSEATQRSKIGWTLLLFLLPIAGWVAYGLARAHGDLKPRTPLA